MTPGMSAKPAWERLRAHAQTRLRVEVPEPRTLGVLELMDGDLPQADEATAFLVERVESGFEVWAARIAPDGSVRTYLLTAARLKVHAADAAVARHLGFDPNAPPSDIEWSWTPGGSAQGGQSAGSAGDADEIVCACRGTTRRQVEAAVRAGSHSVDAVKRATKATFGECQSRQCASEIAGIIGLAEGDPRSGITPRPPLVPVPASILAVFGPQPGEAARPSPLSSSSVPSGG